MGSRKIPRSWAWKRIGEIAEVVGGSTPPRNHPEFFGGSIPWATPTDVTSIKGRYLDGTGETITEAGLRAAGLRLLPPGSVLVSSRATIGAVALAGRSIATNQGFQNLIPGPDVDSLWLYYTVAGRRPDLERLAAGSTFREFSRQSLKHLQIPVPPLYEQVAIARVLDAIDQAIEKTEAVIEATERLRQALLQELLTRGVPGWHSEWKHVPGIGTIPADWEIVTLGEVAEVTSGLAIGPHRKPRAHPKRYLTVANVQAGAVTLGEVRYMELTGREYASRRLVAGDLVLVEGHAQISELGRAAVVPPEASGFVFQNHLFRVRGRPGLCANRFICEFINGPQGRSYFRSFGGTTSGLNTVSVSNVKAMPTPLPGLEEQEVIAAIAEAIAERLRTETLLLEQLRAVKAAVADALLSGRVRFPMSAATAGHGDFQEDGPAERSAEASVPRSVPGAEALAGPEAMVDGPRQVVHAGPEDPTKVSAPGGGDGLAGSIPPRAVLDRCPRGTADYPSDGRTTPGEESATIEEWRL